MADEIAVSIEDLGKSAAQANFQVNTTLSGILNTLRENVAARGKPWGDDSYGSQFYDGSSGYGQVNAATMTNAESLGGVFSQTGTTLLDATKGIKATEEVSSTSFDGS
jgi:hypothetical protein